ncbi:MarR family EPS-associated transcriptional regulator [Limibaculum sp. FT325]|nr:MarR family EPS-associated transcriptional regulator [Limibaculum sediminis]
MRLIEQNPEISQRQLSREVGISLGKLNYCIQALVEKGEVKIRNFRVSPNKLQYAYLLTPAGIAAKASLTAGFLRRKQAEYDALKAEIEELSRELKQDRASCD